MKTKAFTMIGALMLLLSATLLAQSKGGGQAAGRDEETPEKAQPVSEFEIRDRASGSSLSECEENPFPAWEADYVRLGMERGAVQAHLGGPGLRLSENVWVYWNFIAAYEPGPVGRDTLVVVFERDRVSRLRWVDGQPLRTLLAQRTQSAPGSGVALAQAARSRGVGPAGRR